MKQVIAMKKHGGEVSIGGSDPFKMILPPGCTGMLFAFKSKKSAKAYWGNNVELIEYLEARDER